MRCGLNDANEEWKTRRYETNAHSGHCSHRPTMTSNRNHLTTTALEALSGVARWPGWMHSRDMVAAFGAPAMSLKPLAAGLTVSAPCAKPGPDLRSQNATDIAHSRRGADLQTARRSRSLGHTLADHMRAHESTGARGVDVAVNSHKKKTRPTSADNKYRILQSIINTTTRTGHGGFSSVRVCFSCPRQSSRAEAQPCLHRG